MKEKSRDRMTVIREGTYDTGCRDIKGDGVVGGKEGDVKTVNKKGFWRLAISNRRGDCKLELSVSGDRIQVLRFLQRAFSRERTRAGKREKKEMRKSRGLAREENMKKEKWGALSAYGQ